MEYNKRDCWTFNRCCNFFNRRLLTANQAASALLSDQNIQYSSKNSVLLVQTRYSVLKDGRYSQTSRRSVLTPCHCAMLKECPFCIKPNLPSITWVHLSIAIDRLRGSNIASTYLPEYIFYVVF